MKNQFFNIILVSICALLLQGTLSAQPIIKSVKGEFDHGDIINITGSKFGTKSRVSPLIWDDVESKEFSEKWHDTNDLTVSEKRPRHRHSKYHGYLNFQSGKNDGRFRARKQVYPVWYVQYWFKLGRNWKWGTTDFDGMRRFLSNIKVFRLWNPASVEENFVVAINGWQDDIEYVAEQVSEESGGRFLDNLQERMSLGDWHLFQFAFVENSEPGLSDGQFRVWFDGEKLVDPKVMVTRAVDSGLKRPFIIGFSEVWGPNRQKGETDRSPNDFFIDDIYMDNTLARIEIGDNPSYSQCRHREIQVPTEWSNNQIKFRMNQGSFRKGSPAFVFVFDKNGKTNVNGFPVTIGTKGAITKKEEKRSVGVKTKKTEKEKADLIPDVNIVSIDQKRIATFGMDAFEVKIFDPSGDLVRQLTKEGPDRLTWGGRFEDGTPVQPDDYLCKIKSKWGNVLFHTLVVVN